MHTTEKILFLAVSLTLTVFLLAGYVAEEPPCELIQSLRRPRVATGLVFFLFGVAAGAAAAGADFRDPPRR